MQAPPRSRPPAASRALRSRARSPRRRLPLAVKIPLIPVLFVLVIGITAGLVAMLLLPPVGAVGFGVKSVDKALTDAGADFTKIPHFPERSTIYAADGSRLATVYLDENRDIVHLRAVSEIAQKSVLAIEDHGFYEHGAVNLTSLARAMVANLVAGKVVQGGSSITQQLVKNAVTGDTAPTFERKFKELALAIQVERKYSKDEILALYLNEVYLGNGIYGIGTASKFYFHKPAAKLKLPEAAVLAGMIQSPETYDPLDHPTAAKKRRNEVLDRLAELGWVPQAKIDKAKASPVELPPGAGHIEQKTRPFFIYYITQQILDLDNHEFDMFGKTFNQRRHMLFQGGLRIHTTLEPGWMKYAEEAVLNHLPPKNGPDASLVTIQTDTGAIRTMLSGKNYDEDEQDLVWQGRRQVGSAFKPVTLVAAFQNGIPPTKVYESKSPFCSPLWISASNCVYNAEPASNSGWLNLWQATENSVNVVFAQLALEVGPENIVSAARALGITGPLDAVPSITLGAEEVSTLDMATAFSTLANEGVRCRPYAIQRVLLPGGKKLYQHRLNCHQTVDVEIAQLVTAMLEGVVDSGTGTAANLSGYDVAGKTGTAQDYTNVYFAGYTKQYATAVWVGFKQGQIPLNEYYGYSVFGGTLAAPIWHDYMMRIMSGLPNIGFAAPPAPERGTVPDVVGMDSQAAQETLAKAGFVAVVKEAPSEAPKDEVFEQNPGGGTQAVLGSIVKISVSNGKLPSVGVPNVKGMTQANAVAALREAGFVVKVVTVQVVQKDRDGIVLEQSPPPGTKLDIGKTVAISVGKYSKPSPTPTPTPTETP